MVTWVSECMDDMRAYSKTAGGQGDVPSAKIEKLRYESINIWNEEIKPLCPYQLLPGLKPVFKYQKTKHFIKKAKEETFKCEISVGKLTDGNHPENYIFENIVFRNSKG